jgi:hypothetical protein
LEWYDITDRYHGQSLDADGDLATLSNDWQRELAALWRVEADVNNGGYLQFINNWGPDSLEHALAGLQKIGAQKMASLIEECHRLVEMYVDPTLPKDERFRDLMPNPVIDPNGTITIPPPSPIPDAVLEKIDALSYEFMNYPDDIAALGLRYYEPKVLADT